MADKIYKLINVPDITTADYVTCLADSGDDPVKAWVKMADVVLLPQLMDNHDTIQPQMILSAHISTLVHGWGALVAIDETDFLLTMEESLGEDLVSQGYAEEVV